MERIFRSENIKSENMCRAGWLDVRYKAGTCTTHRHKKTLFTIDYMAYLNRLIGRCFVSFLKFFLVMARNDELPWWIVTHKLFLMKVCT